MELVDFLVARIAEDEAVAQTAPTDGALIWSDDGWVPPPWSKVRVLAECEAKRRIVEPWTVEWAREPSGYDNLTDDANWLYGCHAEGHQAVLRLLALPYADHPDYRQEWKP